MEESAIVDFLSLHLLSRLQSFCVDSQFYLKNSGLTVNENFLPCRKKRLKWVSILFHIGSAYSNTTRFHRSYIKFWQLNSFIKFCWHLLVSTPLEMSSTTYEGTVDLFMGFAVKKGFRQLTLAPSWVIPNSPIGMFRVQHCNLKTQN